MLVDICRARFRHVFESSDLCCFYTHRRAIFVDRPPTLVIRIAKWHELIVDGSRLRRAGARLLTLSYRFRTAFYHNFAHCYRDLDRTAFVMRLILNYLHLFQEHMKSKSATPIFFLRNLMNLNLPPTFEAWHRALVSSGKTWVGSAGLSIRPSFCGQSKARPGYRLARRTSRCNYFSISKFSFTSAIVTVQIVGWSVANEDTEPDARGRL